MMTIAAAMRYSSVAGIPPGGTGAEGDGEADVAVGAADVVGVVVGVAIGAGEAAGTTDIAVSAYEGQYEFDPSNFATMLYSPAICGVKLILNVPYASLVVTPTS